MTRLGWLATLLGFSLGLSTCGGGALWDTGCLTDADCKHGRLCSDGTCVYPDTGCQTDEDCLPGQACVAGACLVCDADRDGHASLACGGLDCDDANPAVRPGRIELCGDGLDNDCDGRTDPPELCDDLCRGVSCPPGEACAPLTGRCVPLCQPVCGGRQCGPDGCGGLCGTCPPGERCNQDGRCEPPCLPSCTGRECGPDGCGGSCGACPPGAWCDELGRCHQTCQDECDFAGLTGCLDAYTTARCADRDHDGCLEWVAGQACPAGQRCAPDTGRCVCQDECPWGTIRCWNHRLYLVCGQYDADPCAEWSPTAERCAANETCSEEAGGCVQGCRDECPAGEFACLGQRTYQECGWFDEDPCTEWSAPLPCPPDRPCDPATGQCGGCLPRTCAELWVECGPWDDGCGGTLDCGPCPEGGTCLAGLCSQPGGFGAACLGADGCQTELVCTRVDSAHQGFCNTTCSNARPCPLPFQCLAQVGSSVYCVAICGGQAECDPLGAWECVWLPDLPVGVCLPYL
jgi:hypothetical protein